MAVQAIGSDKSDGVKKKSGYDMEHVMTMAAKLQNTMTGSIFGGGFTQPPQNQVGTAAFQG